MRRKAGSCLAEIRSGLYLYLENVDALAAKFQDEILNESGPENKAWGMYEFAVSDSDETCTVRKVRSAKVRSRPRPKSCNGTVAGTTRRAIIDAKFKAGLFRFTAR